MEHTPTPWGFDGLGNIRNDVFKIGYTEEINDAEFIVRCVNSHDELLDALKSCRDVCYGYMDQTAAYDAFSKAQRAIAKAEGK